VPTPERATPVAQSADGKGLPHAGGPFFRPVVCCDVTARGRLILGGGR